MAREGAWASALAATTTGLVQGGGGPFLSSAEDLLCAHEPSRPWLVSSTGPGALGAWEVQRGP